MLGVLDSQEQALQRLVKNTGVTFAALTENEQQLRTLITSSQRVFEATGSRNDALAESVRIFPTFLDESKATLERLETFSTDTRPLVQDLRPVAVDLKPTLADLRATAPDLEKFFRDLDPLIEASKTGMPAARETIEGAEPLLAQLHPFLGQLNPMLQYLELSQLQVSDFISYGGAALADTTASPGGGIGHYLRQFGPLGAESAAIYPERMRTNRGPDLRGAGAPVRAPGHGLPDQPVVGLPQRRRRDEAVGRHAGLLEARGAPVPGPPAGRLPARRGGGLLDPGVRTGPAQRAIPFWSDVRGHPRPRRGARRRR